MLPSDMPRKSTTTATPACALPACNREIPANTEYACCSALCRQLNYLINNTRRETGRLPAAHRDTINDRMQQTVNELIDIRDTVRQAHQAARKTPPTPRGSHLPTPS